jgi:L,D-peptidoglycan transpeptidase YkuD (ErfK/YbiS/YcfS/YnhG family)
MFFFFLFCLNAVFGSGVPLQSQQIVLATTSGWDTNLVTLSRYQREADGEWQVVGLPWMGRAGTNGLAWGLGLHGDGIPPGQDGLLKHEGDKRTPAGVFALTSVFGDKPLPITHMPYQVMTDSWVCVDDPQSNHYNQILDSLLVQVDWTSAETMTRTDSLYTLGVEIGHNPQARRGSGSCHFLHVWRNAGSTTVGCIAMSYTNLYTLADWIDASKQPVIIILPATNFSSLLGSWDLPGARDHSITTPDD